MIRLFRKKKVWPKRLGSDLLHLVKRSRLFKITIVLSLLFLAGTWVLPILRIAPIGQEQMYIPLHYNVYMGIDRFGPWYHIFFLPMLGSVLLIVNVLFEAAFFQKEKMLSRFFALGTVFAEAALFFSMIFIVLLNL